MKLEASPFNNPLPSRIASGWGCYNVFIYFRPYRGRPFMLFWECVQFFYSRYLHAAFIPVSLASQADSGVIER